MRPFTAALALLGLASLPGLAIADAQRPADSYAYPLQAHRFESQQQSLTMRYADLRPETANGDTVVLLHGKNFCADYWRDTAALLTDAGYRVIAPEQIGFCASDLPRRYQYSFHQLAHNTRGLLDALDIERSIVIGHSMGGMLATRYALMYPDAVQRLILVNPIGLEDWKALGVPYTDIDTLYAAERRKSAESIRAYQLENYYDGEWKPAYDPWVDRLVGLYQGPRGDDVAWSQALTAEMLYSQPVVYEFPRLTVDTVLMIGQRDRTAPGRDKAPPEAAQEMGDYPQLGRSTAAAIPAARLIEFDGLGHLPQIEDFDRFAAALRDVLGQGPEDE